MGGDVEAEEHLKRLNSVGGCHLEVSISTVQVIKDLGQGHRKVSRLLFFNQCLSELLDHLSVSQDSIARLATKHYYEILSIDIDELCVSSSFIQIQLFFLLRYVVTSDGDQFHFIQIYLRDELLADLFSYYAEHHLSTVDFMALFSFFLANAATMFVTIQWLTTAGENCYLI